MKAPEEKLKSLQDWVKVKDAEVAKIKEEQKRQDIIAFSEYQVKDFANWCIRITNEQSNMWKKWILEGPDFLFNEWKKNRNL